jgi:hypothetical protein
MAKTLTSFSNTYGLFLQISFKTTAKFFFLI